MMTKSVQKNGATTGGVTGRGFKPGRSGNPGGRPKGLAAKARAATKDGQALIDFWTKVYEDESASMRDRLEASKLLAERGFGKPALTLEADFESDTLMLTRLVALASASSN
jgi:hypothetical protein